MAEHELKCWPEYFQEVWNGNKNFELRKNDRDYQTGDMLRLMEWDPKSSDYTDRVIYKTIKYILSDEGARFGLEQGYCILGL